MKLKLIGALTSKPYAFTSRPWELDNVNSIDYHDAMGSNIQVSVKGSEIFRILPKVNERINEEWITDKIRFSYDGLKQQRIFSPLLKTKNNKFIKISWADALLNIKNQYDKKNKFEGIIGHLNDVETIFTFKNFLNKIGSSHINSNKKLPLNDLRSNYLLNIPLDSIKNTDLCLLVNINPRIELPLLNLKLRKNVLNQTLKVYSLGPSLDLTFPVKCLGNKVQDIYKIVEGKHKFSARIKSAKNPIILVEQTIPTTLDTSLNTHINSQIINRLFPFIGDIAALETNAIQTHKKNHKQKNKVLYILNDDETVINKKNYDFIIYQGHHGGLNAGIADLILPGSTLVEKNATHINIEGLHQDFNFCIKPPHLARNDWKIFHALSYYLGFKTEYHNFNSIQKEISLLAPQRDITYKNSVNNLNTKTIVKNGYFNNYQSNFYASDIIAKNSNTLNLASNRFSLHLQNFITNKINNDI